MLVFSWYREQLLPNVWNHFANLQQEIVCLKEWFQPPFCKFTKKGDSISPYSNSLSVVPYPIMQFAKSARQALQVNRVQLNLAHRSGQRNCKFMMREITFRVFRCIENPRILPKRGPRHLRVWVKDYLLLVLSPIWVVLRVPRMLVRLQMQFVFGRFLQWTQIQLFQKKVNTQSIFQIVYSKRAQNKSCS